MWKEFYSNLIIQECISIINTSPNDKVMVCDRITKHFGLTSSLKYVDTMAVDPDWIDVPDIEWAYHIKKCEQLVPVLKEHGSHCYNMVYEFQTYFIDIVFQFGDPEPITILRKMK